MIYHDLADALLRQISHMGPLGHVYSSADCPRPTFVVSQRAYLATLLGHGGAAANATSILQRDFLNPEVFSDSLEIRARAA